MSKVEVKTFWQAIPCGTRGLNIEDRAAYFREIEEYRYRHEPFIRTFSRFEQAAGKKVLEVGVGAGSDFINWVRNGASAVGIDLTQQGLKLTMERLALEGRSAVLGNADAENLPFPDNTFDVVYSWGVIHHTPKTERAAEEILRVLKPGGVALVMIYHRRSWVALQLWGLRCLLMLRPWKSFSWAISRFLESPGTKAYSRKEAAAMFSRFSNAEISTELTPGDRMEYTQGKGLLYRAIAFFFPGWLVNLLGKRFGFFMLINAVK